MSTSTTTRPTRPGRRGGLLLGAAALVLLVATACNGPASSWVPDGNGDGQITQDEIDQQRRVLGEAVEAHRRANQAHPFLACVRAHESDTAGGYLAQNPVSTASGAYQFLDSTWRIVAPKAGHPGYARAVHAPWWVQDEVALHVLRTVGKSPWAGTGC